MVSGGEKRGRFCEMGLLGETGTAQAAVSIRRARFDVSETGYGYIEAGAPDANGGLRGPRFTEKPHLTKTTPFLAAGNHFWKSGMVLWRGPPLATAPRGDLPITALL